jgi:hypothetical protein
MGDERRCLVTEEKTQKNAQMPRHAAAPVKFLSADVALIGLNIGNGDKICS